MQPEGYSRTTQDENDFLMLDLEDMEPIEFGNDESISDIEPKKNRKKDHAIRKNIEDILAERELRRRITDVFDEDMLLD